MAFFDTRDVKTGFWITVGVLGAMFVVAFITKAITK